MNTFFFLWIIVAGGLTAGEALAQITPAQDNGSTTQSAGNGQSDALDPVLDTTRSGTRGFDATETTGSTGGTGNTGFNNSGMTGSATGGTGFNSTGAAGFGTAGNMNSGSTTQSDIGSAETGQSDSLNPVLDTTRSDTRGFDATETTGSTGGFAGTGSSSTGMTGFGTGNTGSLSTGGTSGSGSGR